MTTITPRTSHMLVTPLRRPASRILFDPTIDRVPPTVSGFVVESLEEPRDGFSRGDQIVFCPHNGQFLPVEDGQPELMTVPKSATLCVLTKTDGDQMFLRPTRDRILVKSLAAAEVSKGGIIIPDNGQEKPQEAVVIAVGPGRYSEKTGLREPSEIKPGDTVYYSKYSGIPYTMDNGDEVLILENGEAMAVVDHK